MLFIESKCYKLMSNYYVKANSKKKKEKWLLMLIVITKWINIHYITLVFMIVWIKIKINQKIE